MIAILGAGIVGLCMAFRLKSSGREVVVCDPNGISSGSSAGRSRAFRPPYPCGYQSEIFPAALEAYRRLEKDLGANLLTSTMCVEFGEPGFAKFAKMRSVLQDVNAPFQDLSPSDVRKLFPGHTINFEGAMRRDDCGVINAELAVSALVSRLKEMGVQFRSQAVASWTEQSNSVDAYFSDGTNEKFAAIVLATGCWTETLQFPMEPGLGKIDFEVLAAAASTIPMSFSLVKLKLWSTEESVFTFKPAIGKIGLPGLVSLLSPFNGGFAVTVEGDRVKIIERVGGPQVKMSERPCVPRADSQQRCAEFLASLSPAITWQLVEEGTCCYEWTQDYLPLVGQLGANVWICSSFTGGGFKLAPLMAELVTQGFAGDISPMLNPFRPGRSMA